MGTIAEFQTHNNLRRAMKTLLRVFLLWAVGAGLVPGTAFAASGDAADQTKITVRCDGLFHFDDKKNACVVTDESKFKTLDEEACKRTIGAKWASTGCKSGEPTTFPAPNCGTAVVGLEYNTKDKACQIARGTPRSAQGDYVGDCFKIVASPPEGLALNLPENTYWNVMSQAPLGEKDKELIVAPAAPIDPSLGLLDLSFGCREKRGASQRVSASSLIATGAHRYGWAYGVLVLPFKYHRHDKSFTPGTLTIGPYLGRRWGSAGSGFTAAMAATLGSVRGEERNAQGAITATPDLTAFSWALGGMLDVSKNPDLRPFKVGLFWGSDRVNGSDAVTYKHNRKHWLAFQIGFDFTDN
jgi:hypothetical protein